MLISGRLALALSVCFVACERASAGFLVDHGSYFTDTNQNLDILDFTATANLSRVEVEAQLNPGGIFAGWRYATIAETAALFLNLGPYHDGVSELNFQGVREFFDLAGVGEFDGDLGFNGGYSVFGDTFWDFHYGERDVFADFFGIVFRGHVALYDPEFSPSPDDDNRAATGTLFNSAFDGSYRWSIDEKHGLNSASLLVRDAGGQQVTAVPEPASLGLMLLGVIGLTGRAWRKHRIITA